LLETLSNWNLNFVEDALGHMEISMTKAEALEAMQRAISADDLFVWEKDGQVVSMARIGRRLSDKACSVSLVYTPREHRGHGYARVLLTTLCESLQAQGQRVFLFADMQSNFNTVPLYEKIGFSNEGVHVDIRFSYALSQIG